MPEDQPKHAPTPPPTWHRPWVPLWTIGAVIVLVLLIFAGVAASVRWHGMREGVAIEQRGFMMKGGTYGEVPQGGGRMMAGSPGRHGGANRLLGSVTKIDGNTLTVHSNGKDYTVNVQSTTSFYNQDGVSKLSDLTVNDVVSVVGSPDSSGTIQAVRILIQ